MMSTLESGSNTPEENRKVKEQLSALEAENKQLERQRDEMMHSLTIWRDEAMRLREALSGAGEKK
jgi:hypothetical protein